MSGGNMRLIFELDGADDDFWSCESPAVPRVGDHVSLLNTDGDARLEGEVVHVCWGQTVVKNRGAGVWVPTPWPAPPCVTITVAGTVTNESKS